jgi:hypothetical protein
MARCIDDLVQAAKGAISKKEAKQIIDDIEKRFNQPFPKKAPRGNEKFDELGGKSPEQRMVEAAEQAFADRLAQKQKQVRQHELQIEAANRNQYQVVRFTKNGQYNKALSHIINALVGGRVKAVTNELMAELYRGLEPYLSRIGFRKLKPEEELSLAKLLMDPDLNKKFNPDVSQMSEAEYLAYQYRIASDMAYKRANSAGADIKELPGRVPQSWESRSVRYYGLSTREQLKLFSASTPQPLRARYASRAMQRWVDFVLPLMDRERYRHPESGEPLNDEEMREVMASVWRTIATRGLAKAPDGLVTENAIALADAMGAHRELHFKDAESYLQANKAFGKADMFQSMIGDLRRKSQSIALMEQFGPDPETGFLTADAYAKSQQAEATSDGRNGSLINRLMFDELMGKSASAAEDRQDLANRFMQGARNYITAAKMGMLLLSQVNDIATFRAIAQTDGLDTGRSFRMALKLLDPLNKADREIARKQAILSQSVINEVAERFGAEQVSGLSRKLANWTVTLTGAEHWTNAMKMAFQSLIGSHVSDYRGLTFEELQPDFRNMLERYDIRGEDWDIIRQSESVGLAGVDVVTPYLVARIVPKEMHEGAYRQVQEAAAKYGTMLNEEGDTGMLSPDVHTHALINESTRPGTLWGEFARSVMLFKTFSIAMLTKALPRVFAEGAGYSRASIAAQWAVGMIIGGAISMQLKDIAKGKNPQNMNPIDDPAQAAKFWGSAALQSGGLGIFGDFLFAQENRFGGGLLGTVAGPVAGAAEDLHRLVMGNVQMAADGKVHKRGPLDHFTAEGLQLAKNYAPLINLWYTRLALDHLLFFTVQEAANPGYLRRMKRKGEEDNRSWWWNPGDNLPDGGPDLKQMFQRR